MTDRELALEIVDRLNELIEVPAVAGDVARLISARVVCSAETELHPTIQTVYDPTKHAPTVGVLGLLNGIVGAHQEGVGHITAAFDAHQRLVRFALT